MSVGVGVASSCRVVVVVMSAGLFLHRRIVADDAATERPQAVSNHTSLRIGRVIKCLGCESTRGYRDRCGENAHRSADD